MVLDGSLPSNRSVFVVSLHLALVPIEDLHHVKGPLLGKAKLAPIFFCLVSHPHVLDYSAVVIRGLSAPLLALLEYQFPFTITIIVDRKLNVMVEFFPPAIHYPRFSLLVVEELVAILESVDVKGGHGDLTLFVVLYTPSVVLGFVQGIGLGDIASPKMGSLPLQVPGV